MPRYAHIRNSDEDYLEITVITAGLGGNTETHTHIKSAVPLRP